MYELIFYTIPGLLAVVSGYFWFLPSLTEGQTIALISISPIAGYFFHQFFRLFFERTDGHWRKSRAVIGTIKKRFSKKGKFISRQQAFLIWEMTIYHEKSSAHFLEHDARMWRFIVSHWALSFTSLLIIVVLFVCGIVFQGLDKLLWQQQLILILLVFIGIVFRFVGYQVLSLLNIQELAYFEIKNELFKANAKSIMKTEL